MNPIFYFVLFLSVTTLAGPLHGSNSGDPSTYEAITGESAEDAKAVWDSYYKNKSSASSTEPIGFLKEHLGIIPKGRAFLPAMGEGRNAVFLAKMGFMVEGNDLSQIAIDRATQSAKKQGVQIKAEVVDLDQFKYPTERYDFILVSLFYIENLIPKLKSSLKKGGYLMFYEKRDTGKPQKKIFPNDFLVKSVALKNSLQDFEIKDFREYRDQGVEVIGVLARKP